MIFSCHLLNYFCPASIAFFCTLTYHILYAYLSCITFLPYAQTTLIILTLTNISSTSRSVLRDNFLYFPICPLLCPCFYLCLISHPCISLIPLTVSSFSWKFLCYSIAIILVFLMFTLFPLVPNFCLLNCLLLLLFLIVCHQ